MIIDVVTIFPKMFSPVIGESITKRAQAKGLVKINLHDLRSFSNDPHSKVDAPSYGGGGMVFTPQPLFSAVEKLTGSREKKNPDTRVILFSPQGKPLTQKRVRKFLKYEHLVLIAPRYEGVDERVRKHLVDEEVSIGDYVLSGGELPAMVLIDSIVRLIPGVVSDQQSVQNESFEKGLLDYPHYTRPQEFKGMKVPNVLCSGDHKKINEWRKKKALENTKKKRPDLMKLNETSPRKGRS
jgi:tRNA (guanine37-N1)-methyltransferase